MAYSLMVHENTAATQALNNSRNVLEYSSVPNGSDMLNSHLASPRCSEIFPSSIALFLLPENKRNSSEYKSSDGENADQRFERLPSVECNVEDLFSAFVDSNRKCKWSSELQIALSDLRPTGLLLQNPNSCYLSSSSSLVLLLGSKREASSLTVLKDCWYRGILRPPKEFILEKLGESASFEISLITKGAQKMECVKCSTPTKVNNNSSNSFTFSPSYQQMTDIICSSVLDLTEQNKHPNQLSIIQSVKERQHSEQQPSVRCTDEQIISFIDSLVKERKLQLSCNQQQIYRISSSPSMQHHNHYNNDNQHHNNRISKCYNSSGNHSRPLSFVNQHAGVIKDNNQLFYSTETENNNKPFTAVDSPQKDFIPKSPSKIDAVAYSLGTFLGNEMISCKQPQTTQIKTTSASFDCPSESDSPKNCVQSFSKLLSKYKHNNSSYTKKNKKLITFSAQFPPEDGSNLPQSECFSRGKTSSPNKFPPLSGHQCQINSHCNDSCCSNDIYSIIRHLQQARLDDSSFITTGNSKLFRSSSPRMLKHHDSIANRSQNSGNPETIVSSSYKNSSGCSAKFVAYLPEDMTRGSGSIVKCPINTPHWAKDLEFKEARRGRRHRNFASHYTRSPRSPHYLASGGHHSKVEYSHHNYFHHQYHKNGKKHRRKAMINCSPSRLTTSDEVYNVLYGAPAGSLDSRAGAAAAITVLNTPSKTKATARIQVLSSDDSVFSYYQAKYHQRSRRHHRRLHKKRDAAEKQASILTIEPNTEPNGRVSTRSSKLEGSENSQSFTSTSVKIPEIMSHRNSAHKKENEDSGITIDSHSPCNFVKNHSPKNSKNNFKLC